MFYIQKRKLMRKKKKIKKNHPEMRKIKIKIIPIIQMNKNKTNASKHKSFSGLIMPK
jgi:hypothetical protein